MAVRARAGTVDGAQAVCVRVANRLLAGTHGDRCPSDPARSEASQPPRAGSGILARHVVRADRRVGGGGRVCGGAAASATPPPELARHLEIQRPVAEPAAVMTTSG